MGLCLTYSFARAHIQAYAVEENVKEKKHGQHEKEQWRKSWK